MFISKLNLLKTLNTHVFFSHHMKEMYALSNEIKKVFFCLSQPGKTMDEKGLLLIEILQ